VYNNLYGFSCDDDMSQPDNEFLALISLTCSRGLVTLFLKLYNLSQFMYFAMTAAICENQVQPEGTVELT